MPDEIVHTLTPTVPSNKDLAWDGEWVLMTIWTGWDDWGGENEVGLSEFVVRAGVEVTIKSVTKTMEYCK